MEEELIGEDRAAGEQSCAATESSSDGEATEVEPPEELPALKKTKRVLRKGTSGIPASQPSSGEDVPGKKATGKAAARQGARQQPPRRARPTSAVNAETASASHIAAPEAEVAGSHQPPAPATAKRPRTPPPPPQTDIATEVDFDISGFSSGEEEEE